MPRLRYHGPDDDSGPEPAPLPFAPPEPDPDSDGEDRVPGEGGAGAPVDSEPSEALEALDTVSRRMEDLARLLGCLGYFDDDDRPRAA